MSPSAATPPPARIELTTRAERDLRKLAVPERRRIASGLAELAAGTENLDIKPLTGLSPWLRLRIGEWRVLYRPTSEKEGRDGGRGWFIGRIINRRELERATRTLT